MQNKILRITKRFNSSEVEVKDSFGRSLRLVAGVEYSVGNKVLVTNGIVVRKVAKTLVKTFMV